MFITNCHHPFSVISLSHLLCKLWNLVSGPMIGPLTHHPSPLVEAAGPDCHERHDDTRETILNHYHLDTQVADFNALTQPCIHILNAIADMRDDREGHAEGIAMQKL